MLTPPENAHTRDIELFDLRNVPAQHVKVGEELETMITNVDRKSRGVNLSIKAKDQAEQHEAMQKIASDNAASGTTNLGALLKAKLNNQG